MTSTAVLDQPFVDAAWPRWLLWSGVPLCAFGIWQSGIWRQWEVQRAWELLVLSVLASLGAWAIRRSTGWSLGSSLVVVCLLALAVFAGPLSLLSTALLAAGAIALGGCIAPRDSSFLKCACGMMLLAGMLGWLLPLPVHFRWTYLPALLALVFWRRHALLDDLRSGQRHWRELVAEHPLISALAMLALGLALTGCWLPTLQADDTAYHLRLPWQLLEYARYPLDPTYNVWSLAPWSADILQAIPQLIAGQESRGPVNALWIAITAAGVWQLAIALGGTRGGAWIAVATYASLPLTASLATTMQTETPTAALLSWLMALIAQAPDEDRSRVRPATILVGGLLGLKLAAAAFALLVLPWALLRVRARVSAATLSACGAAAVLIGGSSYAYAGITAGNPILPLCNAWFHSPYFGPFNFDDPRWHAGLTLALPWQLTFQTGRYMEAYDGGVGFVIVALAGAWLLALLHRRTRGAAITCSALFWLPLIPIQYLRYVFPALVALVPLLVVTTYRVHPRSAAALLLTVCVLNFAFQSNSNWLLRTGGVRETVRWLGDDNQRMFENYAPERVLIRDMRAHGGPTGNVLYTDPGRPYLGELGDRGRVVNWYAPGLESAAGLAEQDPTGAAWAALLRRNGVSDVLVSEKSLGPAQGNGLRKLGARRRQGLAGLEWWSLPTTGAAP